MELVIALIAAVVAIASAIISFFGQRKTTILQNDLTKEREQQSREARADALLSKYRDPLLRSAYSLQSRCFSIVQLDFLRIYYNKSERDKLYSKHHTLYVFAEYLGWVEVIRREIQFLDFGNIEATKRLQQLLHEVSFSFLTDGIPLNFRLFSGEQRAIGELILTDRNRGDGATFDCIGFAEFSHRVSNDELSHWFEKLKESIETAANEDDPEYTRLTHIQHGLIDLIDFLDPDHIRIPSNREKI